MAFWPLVSTFYVTARFSHCLEIPQLLSKAHPSRITPPPALSIKRAARIGGTASHASPLRRCTPRLALGGNAPSVHRPSASPESERGTRRRGFSRCLVVLTGRDLSRRHRLLTPHTRKSRKRIIASELANFAHGATAPQPEPTSSSRYSN